ncbi:MAG: DNA replication/repair protein RecF, partial [Dictyoglomus sp.]
MFLEELKVVNFRNLKNLNLRFSEVNIFYGENAQGKTNLLESIYFLFSGKSFRTKYEKELVRWGEESFYIKGNVKWQSQNLILEVALSQDTKKIKINQKNLKRQKDMVFLFPLVLFSQEEIEYFKKGPSQRRFLLNRFLSTLSYKYHKTLSEYYKVLYQRNLTLKNNRDVSIWNSSLIKLGSYILLERVRLIKEIKETIKEVSRSLLGVNFLDIDYFSTIPISESEEEILRNFELKLKETEEEEKRKRYTLVGPHRDDLILKIIKDELKYDLKRFGSAGEKKLGYIIWKLSQVKILSDKRKEKPIFLLDDLFGDLDEKKQEIVWEGIKSFQIFISTPVRV